MHPNRLDETARNDLSRVLAHLSDENKRLQKENERLSQTQASKLVELEEQLELFTGAIESLSDGLLIYDASNKIVAVNSAFKNIMATLNVKCDIGMTRRELLTNLLEAGVIDRGDKTVAAWLEYHFEHLDPSAFRENDRQIGDSHFIRHSSPIVAGGEVMTLTDVTKMKAALDKAELAERAKSEFLANMSHEIRTPMNGIIGMTEILGFSELTSRQRELIDTISRSGDALMTIINDILDFSKIEAGHVKLDPIPFVLRDSIEDVTALLSSSAADKNIDLLVRIQHDLPSTYLGDVGRFRQVMTNLVGNALKFTHFGHVLVDVSGHVNNGVAELQIRVEDTGIGIPESDLEHVFKKFQQVDGSTTRKYEGTGLGLSISMSLVQLMGGTISVESEIDEGSIFSFTIPLASHADIKPQKHVPVEIIGTNILIVDDNQVNRTILCEKLKHWQCRSIAVESGPQAIQVLENAKKKDVKIDLIISDYQMPGMNGEDLFDTLQADPDFAKIPRILLTSINDDDPIKRLQKKGLAAVLTKPTRCSQLLDTIEQCISEAQCTANNITDKPIAKILTDSRRQTLLDIEGQGPLADAAAKSKLDVLIAEDNETNQIYMKYIMEEFGVSFKIVPNGRAALDYWRSANPRIVLMDISMPEMNGYEATKAIRENENQTGRPRTPIIAVTAHTIQGAEKRCIDAGMDDYISKPVSMTVLEAIMKRWMKSEGKQANRWFS